MKKSKIIIIFFILFASVVGLVFVFWTHRQTAVFSSAGNEIKEISLGGRKIKVEIVTTPEKQALGLSGRENLCADCGMLFVFKQPGNYAFWMKDMRFNLDIVWISDGEVTSISKNIPFAPGATETVHPSTPVDEVLEVNAGESDRLGLKIGDKSGL